MSVSHLLIREKDDRRYAFCHRSVVDSGVVVDERDDHDYPADGVTCKWCLKRLGVRSVPTGQVPASQYETLRAERDRLAAEVDTLRRERDEAIRARDHFGSTTASVIADRDAALGLLWRVLDDPSEVHDIGPVLAALFGGLRVELASAAALEWMRDAAREAIRLGADPSKVGKP